MATTSASRLDHVYGAIADPTRRAILTVLAGGGECKVGQLAERFPSVYAAVGWHPCQATAAPEDLRPSLREMAPDPRTS